MSQNRAALHDGLAEHSAIIDAMSAVTIIFEIERIVSTSVIRASRHDIVSRLRPKPYRRGQQETRGGGAFFDHNLMMREACDAGAGLKPACSLWGPQQASAFAARCREKKPHGVPEIRLRSYRRLPGNFSNPTALVLCEPYTLLSWVCRTAVTFVSVLEPEGECGAR